MIDAIGIGIVFPIMPDLMDRVGAGSAAEGALWGGVMMSAYAAAMFLFGPIVGSLSDAYGRRPILIAGAGHVGYRLHYYGTGADLLGITNGAGNRGHGWCHIYHGDGLYF